MLTPSECAELANAIQRFLVNETRLGIPTIVHEECCAGFTARGATQFPQAIGLASTWNPALVEEMTRVIRAQMRAVGAHQALAPVLDLARDPRWGRTEETFGEDPYLVSRLGVAYVRGLQGADLREGIAATGKHFIGYGASEGGLNWAPAHLGRRELLELFALPFEAAIREAGLATVMNAYHEIDGQPCGASREMLDELLRGVLGFDGMVVSDYFTVQTLLHATTASPRTRARRRGARSTAGIDVELPALDCMGAPLARGARRRSAATWRSSIAPSRARCGSSSRSASSSGPSSLPAPRRPSSTRRRSARWRGSLARQSIVLLQNRGALLPLDPRPEDTRRDRPERRERAPAARRLPLPDAPRDHVRRHERRLARTAATRRAGGGPGARPGRGRNNTGSRRLLRPARERARRHPACGVARDAAVRSRAAAT